MTEREFLEKRLTALRDRNSKIPEVFKRQQEQGDAEIATILRKADLFDAIEAVKSRTDDQKKKLQKEADIIANLIAGLQEILEKFHLAPIPEGVTHMHGLELEPLSWETRLMVMAGNEETITALGGAIAKPVTIMPKSKPARTSQRK